MAKPGPRPGSAAAAEREGNPSKRTRPEGLGLAPAAPRQPNWAKVFPDVGPDDEGPDEAALLRADARKQWRLVVDELDPIGSLALVDAMVLQDFCVCVARIAQCERDISRRGVWVKGERGAVKNPSSTAANQYRTQLRFYVSELGLSPSSRSRLEPLEGDDDGDSPFDV